MLWTKTNYVFVKELANLQFMATYNKPHKFHEIRGDNSSDLNTWRSDQIDYIIFTDYIIQFAGFFVLVYSL